MGRIDTCTKDYVKDNTIFADIFNHFIYQGEIHYAMPVKCMVYDALDYASRVEKAAKSHRDAKQKEQNKKEKKSGKLGEEDECRGSMKVTSGEYLTGFYKEDRLIPVVTLVIYFGANEWDGPRNLHQMFAVQDEKLLALMPDYKINLLAPREMSDKEIEQFQTDFREVMLFCKYMKDKEKLSELFRKNPAYRNMDQKAIRVIEAVANTKIQVNEKEEKGNMCEGLQGIIDDAIQEEKRKAVEERRRAEEERKRADLAEERLRKEKTKMALLLRLSKDGRNDDIGRISVDEEYGQQLMKEYGMM